MTLRRNKIKVYFIKSTYILVGLITIQNLIFRERWAGGESIPDEPYFIYFLSGLFSTVIFGLIWVSVVLVHRLRFKDASIIGLVVCNLIGFDLFIILQRYEIALLSPIGYYHLLTITVIMFLSIYLLVILFNKSEKAKITIKQTLLNFGTQFLQLEIIDIAEKCSINRTKVEIVIQEMIKNKEIYASYSKKSKTIEFAKETNIEEIDNLMKIYEKWESEIYGKK
ncbi:MAG: PCI domain-containing protein [Promethearchaeota archaeon]|jgi:hypothetical protein